MTSARAFIYKWGPLVLMMGLIFAFSSVPKRELPDFYQWDTLFKKGGHVLGYCLLALACWHGLGWDKKRWWIAWGAAIIYAVTDEIHQSFVPGRTSLLSDVVIDSIAAAVGIFVKFLTKK